MQFANPNGLWILAVTVPAMILFLWWSRRTRERLTLKFIPARLVESLILGVSTRRRKFRATLLVVAVALALIALARPQWGFSYREVQQRGLDIIVALDTSRSMLAEDAAPNRLARAKLAAMDLRRIAEADRIGLIAFAGTAFLQMPMSTDPGAFSQHIDSLDTTVLPQGGTALTEAIQAALGAFKDSQLDNHKALILFTDGEDHDGEAIQAAREAAKQGLTVFTIGVGTTQGELVPVRDAKGRLDFIKEENGNAVKSRLNEQLLRDLAQAGKGFYLALSTPNAMEALYQRGLASLPKREFQTSMTRQYVERYQWFLGLALLGLLIEWLVPDRRRPAPVPSALRPKAVLALLLFLVLGLPESSWATPSAARKHFEAGRYKNALAEYERLLKQSPQDSPLHYNAGSAAYQAGKLDSAMDHFSAALSTPDLKLQQQAYYNRGNTQYRTGETSEAPDQTIAAWEKAVQDYESALKLDPNDIQSKHNRDLVQKRLEELKKQQQENQKQDQNQDDKQDDKDNKKEDKKDGKDSKDQNSGQEDSQSEKKQDPNKQDSSKNDQQEKEGKDSENSPDKQKDPKDSQKQDSEQSSKPKPGEEEGSQEGEKGQAKDERKQQPGEEQQGQQGKQGEQAKAGDTNAPAGTSQQLRVMQMTQQQAMQLLEALRSEERMLRPTPLQTNRLNRNPRSFKDW